MDKDMVLGTYGLFILMEKVMVMINVIFFIIIIIKDKTYSVFYVIIHYK